MPHRRPARLHHIAGIGVDRMGSIADASGKDFLRLENLDVDIPPDAEAIARTRQAAGEDRDNSYLPFIGQTALRDAAARHVSAVSGVTYSGKRNCVISAGGLSGILNVLLATIDVGDEVIVTDPTYAGLINRVHLAGGIPRFVPFRFKPGGEWALDREALRAAIGPKVTAMLLMSPSMPSGGYFDADRLGAGRRSLRRQRPAADPRHRDGAAGVRRPSGHSTRPAFPAWRSGPSPSVRPPRNCA